MSRETHFKPGWRASALDKVISGTRIRNFQRPREFRGSSWMSPVDISRYSPTNTCRISAMRRGKTVISSHAWVQNCVRDHSACCAGASSHVPATWHVGAAISLLRQKQKNCRNVFRALDIYVSDVGKTTESPGTFCTCERTHTKEKCKVLPVQN
jgi:hypothetical protein